MRRSEALPLLPPTHPSLRAPCAPVRFPDPTLADDIARLHATLLTARARLGYGRAIAAPQAGVRKRLVVMDLGAGAIALCNPRVTWRSDETVDVWDDCLSMPDCLVRVRRHRSIDLSYEDAHGRARAWARLPTELAELLQHELDHLDGVLMDRRAIDADAVRPIDEHARLVGVQRSAHRLSLERIGRAAETIPREFRDSPQYDCEPLSEALGCRLTIKLDFVNPIRSFKGRGASFFAHERLDADRAPGLVCASAGNWGQALAYACRARGIDLTVYAAVGANPVKLARMRALGARVVLHGDDFDAAKTAAKAHAQRSGALMAEDGLEPEVSEGHGTIGIELLAGGAALDAVVLPLGNGALLAGVARWIKATSPATRVLGVCASGAPAMERSWREGGCVRTERADTIADGIAVREPIAEALADLEGLVDDVLLVEDADILQAARLAWQHAGLMLEPAGAAGLAGIFAHRERFARSAVATLLCGANFTVEFAQEVSRGA